MSTSEDSVTSTQMSGAICSVQSPLWRSLYVTCATFPAINEDTVLSVPSTNNPCPLRAMGDNAEYWVNDGGKAFTFKFPATVDLGGQFDCTGPYFNLPHTRLDLGMLKKMQAQFKICPLDTQAVGTFPEEAIKCSSSALDMLNVLHGEAEEARNAFLVPQLYPRDNPFWRSYGQGDNEHFSVVLTTDMLIGKGDSMQSPSKAKATTMAGGPPGGGTLSAAATPLHPLLSDLPDPLGCYASLIRQYNLHYTIVVALNICDGEGTIIRSQEYNTKIATGTVVVVECQLKLWTIAPNRRDNAQAKDKNGSRRYQVMLKSMKAPKKCPMAEDNEEEDNEDNEDEDGLYSKDTNAMQVSEE
ncbi:hypothetical protein BD769DRAFT_1668981 [Suillus cothurnatus]|nr:hypothetical protein BD769DRAFT_1668981 [Suillus cothurnatus]